MTTNPLLPWERFGTQAVEETVGQVVGQVEGDITAATGIQLPQVEFPTTLPSAQPMGPVPAAPLPTTAAPLPQPAPAPSAPPVAPTGSTLSVIDAGIKEAIAAAMPAIKAQALDYAKAELQDTLAGKTIDQAHPTITVTTAKGKELQIADAKNRSYRTFIQGLSLDIFFALMAMVGTLTGFDPLAKASWLTLGALVLKTIFQTAISYVSRMKITPTTVVDGAPVSLVTIPAHFVS